MNRDNAIGLILLAFCAVVAVVLLYGIATGTRFRWQGPGWVATALVILFIGASIWSFVAQPGRRWPWQRNRDQQEDDDGGRDL